MAELSDFSLHQQIFKGDLKEVSKLIRISDINVKDIHGKFCMVFISIFNVNILTCIYICSNVSFIRSTILQNIISERKVIEFYP